jgi:hypothetical protein
MKKLLKIGLILAALGLIAAALVWKFYVNKPHDDIEKASPVYSMATEQIWKEYTTDSQKSSSQYNNKVIELTGNVSRVNVGDSLVSVVFDMEIDSMFGNKSISCEMLQKYNNEAKALAAGTQVKIKGYCTGYDETDIKLNKCSIVK